MVVPQLLQHGLLAVWPTQQAQNDIEAACYRLSLQNGVRVAEELADCARQASPEQALLGSGRGSHQPHNGIQTQAQLEHLQVVKLPGSTQHL